MKSGDFETIMRMKYETRTKSGDYVEEADKNLVFKKHFKSIFYYFTIVKFVTHCETYRVNRLVNIVH